MTTLLNHPASPLELLGRLSEGARMDAARIVAGPAPAGPAAPVTGRGLEGHPITIAPTSMPLAGLGRVLEERQSHRFYDGRPVRADILTAALQRAVQYDSDVWGTDPENGTGLQIVVAALNLDGLPPALYRFDAAAASYTPLAPLDHAQVAQMVLQMEYADAPVIIATMGSLSRSLESWGDHGERALNQRAAHFSYTALLTANAYGVDGSVFAGFLPSGLSQSLVADGYHLGQVFALALGHRALP